MKLVYFKGLNLQYKKASAGIDVTNLRPTDFYNVSLKVGNIAESEPVVEIGDEVKEGSLIAKPSGNFGINIFSPVSGKVLNIYEKNNDDGNFCKHILIMNNFKDEREDLPEIESVSDITLVKRLNEAGLIDYVSGLPTYLKYAFVGSRSYKNLLVLMCETDPNCSVNQTLAEYRMEEVVNGARYFMNITNANFVTFVFTSAQKRLAEKLKKHILETKKNYDFKIKFIPNTYPFDNEYIIAGLVCNKNITRKTSFLDAGISIETAESCFNFCRAVEFNKPLIGKVVTIDGDYIIRKGNYFVPNGTSYESLLNFIGVVGNDASLELINGNLMKGKAQYDKSLAISMLSNCILLFKFNKYEVQKELNCISCGKCASVCPMFLNPKKIDEAYLDESFEDFNKLGVSSCISCGCCSYVCPSRRYLTQRIENAKFYNKSFGGKWWIKICLSLLTHHLSKAKMMLTNCFWLFLWGWPCWLSGQLWGLALMHFLLP